MFTIHRHVCAFVVGSEFKFPVAFQRCYAFYARRPIRVRYPVTSDNDPAKLLKNTEQNLDEIDQRRTRTRTKGQQDTDVKEFEKGSRKKKKVNSRDSQSHVDEPHEPESTIKLKYEVQWKHLSDAHHSVRNLLKNINSRPFKKKNNLFVADGFLQIKEALDAGVTPEAIFFTRLDRVVELQSKPCKLGLNELNEMNNLPLYRAPYKTLQSLSSLTTSPGILGVFKRPEENVNNSMSHQYLPLTVVLDEVRDPGNLGGILRTLASVGVKHVILTKGCCDPWETKVLRAACGAHFRLKLSLGVTWDILHNYVSEDATVILADVCRDSNTDEKDKLPMLETPRVKPVTKEPINYDDDTVHLYDIDDDGTKLLADPSYLDEEYLQRYKNVQLPVYHYDRLEVFKKNANVSSEAALLIGGETGISNAAKKFVYVREGSQVAVPLHNGMESLNTSVAAGIILYEFHRQFCQLNLLEHNSNIATST